jgi:hypothetical protein
MIFTAILGVGLAYARFAIDYTWENAPLLAVDEQLTAAQFNARAWSERSWKLAEFSVPPVFIFAFYVMARVMMNDLNGPKVRPL